MRWLYAWVYTHKITVALVVAVAVLAVVMADVTIAAHTATLAGPGWTDPTPPPPGCGFTSAVPWSPCSATPPWGQKYPGGYDWTGTVPGRWGPHGYMPIIG